MNEDYIETKTWNRLGSLNIILTSQKKKGKRKSIRVHFHKILILPSF